jgi:hypothetical protein
MTAAAASRPGGHLALKGLGILLAGICLLGIGLTWRTVTVTDGMDEPITRLIEAGVPALASAGFGLCAAALLAQRRSLAWWGLGCLLGSIVYMSLLIAISSLVL